MELLKPEVIQRIENLDLRARVVVKGFFAGLHKSPFHGFSLEFHEHRPYNPGDPINKIDWKLFGRTNRYYLKKYQAETNLSALLLIDKSNSMSYGEKISKFDYSRTLSASLAYLLLKQNDSVGLVLFDSKIRDYIPARSRKVHLKKILSNLQASKPSEKTSISGALMSIAEKIKKRSLIILFTDLLENPEEVAKTVGVLKARKNEVIVFHIMDPAEIDFNYEREAIFRDLEGNREFPVNPGNYRKIYREKMEEFLNDYRTNFAVRRIDYELLTTETSYFRGLSRYLGKRKRMQ